MQRYLAAVPFMFLVACASQPESVAEEPDSRANVYTTTGSGAVSGLSNAEREELGASLANDPAFEREEPVILDDYYGKVRTAGDWLEWSHEERLGELKWMSNAGNSWAPEVLVRWSDGEISEDDFPALVEEFVLQSRHLLLTQVRAHRAALRLYGGSVEPMPFGEHPFGPWDTDVNPNRP